MGGGGAKHYNRVYSEESLKNSQVRSFFCNIWNQSHNRVPTQVLELHSLIKSYICFSIYKALESLIFCVLTK